MARVMRKWPKYKSSTNLHAAKTRFARGSGGQILQGGTVGLKCMISLHFQLHCTENIRS